MKKNSLPKFSKVTLIIAGALFLLLALVEVLKKLNVYLLLFGIGTAELLPFFRISGVLLLLAGLAVWAFKSAKPKLLKGFIVFIAVVAIFAFSLVSFSVVLFSPSGRYFEFTSDDNAHKIVVREESMLLYGGGYIYEKTSFCTMQRVGVYSTDDGFLPFTVDAYYFVWHEEGFDLHHGFYGKDDKEYKVVKMGYIK